MLVSSTSRHCLHFHMNPFRKTVWLFRWLLLVLSPFAWAEEEVDAPLTADYGEYDGKAVLHLIGNVKLIVPDLLTLHCADLVTSSVGGSPDATNVVIVATGDVRLHVARPRRGTNQPVDLMAFAGKAVYTGTNSLFVLTENPRVESAQGTLSATTIYYDVATGSSWATPYRLVPNPKSFKLLDRLSKSSANSLTPVK